MPNIIEAIQQATNAVADKGRKLAKKKSLSSGKFYSVNASLKGDKVVIELPRSVADFLDLSDDSPEIYWAPINGVIQLSGREPSMVIPMISVSADEFIKERE